MRIEDIKDLSKYIEELKRETDRGLPLVAMALLDEKLRDTLESFCVNKKSAVKLLDEMNSPLGTLSSRLDSCFAFGLIDEFEYAEINLLRKIRNEFAHAKHGLSFDNEKIRGLCSTLKTDLPEGEDYPLNDPRFRFTNSVVSLVLRMYYRPEWVAKEQRQTKDWAENTGKWISVKDKKPPEGTPFLAMVKKDKK